MFQASLVPAIAAGFILVAGAWAPAVAQALSDLPETPPIASPFTPEAMVPHPVVPEMQGPG